MQMCRYPFVHFALEGGRSHFFFQRKTHVFAKIHINAIFPKWSLMNSSKRRNNNVRTYGIRNEKVICNETNVFSIFTNLSFSFDVLIFDHVCSKCSQNDYVKWKTVVPLSSFLIFGIA